MKVVGNFNYVGIDVITKKKTDEKFYNLVLLQGTDMVKVFIQPDEIIKYEGLKPLEKLEVELSINITQDRTYVNVEKFKIMG